jgi:phage head maturation protease
LAEIDADQTVSYVGDLVKLIERGDARGGSFAFSALDDAWSLVDGQPFREVLDMRIREVSLGVTFPAYAATASDGQARQSIALAERRIRLAMIR